jgi:hypothetical protein
MKNKIYSIFFSIVVLCMMITAGDIYAYPKFAALYGSKCSECHINPTGGGIRNPFGVKIAKENLYWKVFEKANKTASDFDPVINKTFQLGSDFRMIFINDQISEGVPDFNTFFQMQGDFWVHAKISKYLSLTTDIGLYLPNTFGPNPLPTKYEIYGMISNLPAGLYLKVGRFIPNFGLKIPEHRAYNRQLNGFYTPYAADAGFELGISPSLFNLTVGFSNGSSPDKNGTVNNTFDFDSQKQVVVSGDFRWSNKKETLAFGLGGSFLSNPFKYDAANNINALRQIAAGYLMLGLGKRVSILGEFDYNRLDLKDADNTRADFTTIFGEMDVRIFQGVEAKFQFENYNPQLGVPDAPLQRRRYSFGFNFFPITGLEIESIYRVVDEPGLPSDQKIKNNEFQETFKVYF